MWQFLVSGRAPLHKKLSDEVLAWLSLWRLQIVCILSSWCHHPKTPSSLASFKSRLVLPFLYWLTQVVLEKRPLNECSTSSSLIKHSWWQESSCIWRQTTMVTSSGLVVACWTAVWQDLGSNHRRRLCLSGQPLWHTALDMGCTSLLQCLCRLSLSPSVIRQKWISAFRLSNTNKRQQWCG